MPAPYPPFVPPPAMQQIDTLQRVFSRQRGQFAPQAERTAILTCQIHHAPFQSSKPSTNHIYTPFIELGSARRQEETKLNLGRKTVVRTNGDTICFLRRRARRDQHHLLVADPGLFHGTARGRMATDISLFVIPPIGVRNRRVSKKPTRKQSAKF